MHVPIFGGLSGSEDRGGGDNSIQFMNDDEKWGGGGRVGDNSILTYLCHWLDKKKCYFKKLHFGQFFLFVVVKFLNS